MIPRVYAPDARASGDRIDVPSDEAHWLRDVLRLRPGQDVRVFDGRGHEWHAAITASTKTMVSVTLGSASAPAPEPRIAYVVAMPVLKGDATDTIVRDAVMMGAHRLRPFVSTRSETSLATVQRGRRRDRWQRVAIASAKQCGRATIPAVDEVVSFVDIVGEPAHGRRLLFVEPAFGTAMRTSDLEASDTVVIATGPEGGWTPEEVRAAAAAGWQLVRSGGRVLRAEAAPLVALAACQAVWQDT